jgi:hypothetical protein
MHATPQQPTNPTQTTTPADIVLGLGVDGGGELVRTFGGPMTGNLVAAMGHDLTADIVKQLGPEFTGAYCIYDDASAWEFGCLCKSIPVHSAVWQAVNTAHASLTTKPNGHACKPQTRPAGGPRHPGAHDCLDRLRRRRPHHGRPGGRPRPRDHRPPGVGNGGAFDWGAGVRLRARSDWAPGGGDGARAGSRGGLVERTRDSSIDWSTMCKPTPHEYRLPFNC